MFINIIQQKRGFISVALYKCYTYEMATCTSTVGESILKTSGTHA